MKKLKKTWFIPLFATVLASAGCSDSGGDDDSTGGASGSGGSGTAGSGGSPSAGTGPTAGSTSAGSGGSSTAGTGGSGMACNSTLVLASEVNNYSFSSTLTMPSVTVAPNTEVHFEWGGLTKDFLKHDVDPLADIDNINVILWQLSEAELATKLNDDSSDSQDYIPPVAFATMNATTSADLFDFTAVGGGMITEEEFLSYLDPTEFDPATNTFTAIVTTGEISSGGDVRMIQTFRIDPASTNSTVTLTDTSTTLMYATDLQSLQPTMIPGGNTAIEFDWGDVETNAMGAEFLPTQITRARVAHYNETPAELEDKFLDLELIATATYEAAIPSGVSVVLSDLKTESGQAFTGIDGNGTWLFALFCGNCKNPAPWYLTVLKPCN